MKSYPTPTILQSDAFALKADLSKSLIDLRNAHAFACEQHRCGIWALQNKVIYTRSNAAETVQL